MCDTVIDNGIELFRIHLSIHVKNTLVGGFVDDLTDTYTVIIEFYKLTFHRHGKLIDDRRIYVLAFGGVKSRSIKFIGNVISRNDADVATRHNCLRRCKLTVNA